MTEPKRHILSAKYRQTRFSVDEAITQDVLAALTEDVGEKDLTADLIPVSKMTSGIVISRENAIFCGLRWFNEVFKQVDLDTRIDWQVKDGEAISNGQTLCTIKGKARSILTAERCALNFLQTLSATATTTRQYSERISHTHAILLDTRKTIPGLRVAQKYAVNCGGGQNHRMGLFDAILIKENHIQAAGSITKANHLACSLYPKTPIEVEVENLPELEEALSCGVKLILLDNFSIQDLSRAVATTSGRATLEASGSITLDNIAAIAETGVDYISTGILTKNIQAIDLSLRFTD